MAMIGRNAAIAEVGPKRRELHGRARVRVVARRARLAARAASASGSTRSRHGDGTTSPTPGRRRSSIVPTRRASTGTDRMPARSVGPTNARFRGEPAIELSAGSAVGGVRATTRDDRRVAAMPRRGAPRASRWARRAARRHARRVCRCSHRGRTGCRGVGIAPSGVTVDLARPTRSASMTTGCRSTDFSSVERLVGRSARRSRRHGPAARRRSTSMVRPSRSRIGSRSQRRSDDAQLRVDTTIVPLGRRSGAGRVRVASRTFGSPGAPRQPMAVATSRPRCTARSTTAASRTAPREREPAETGHDRDAHVRRPVRRSDVTEDSRSRATTAVRSNCTAGPTIRTRRCGFPRAARSPPSNRWRRRRTHWSSGDAPIGAPRRTLHRNVRSDARPIEPRD